MPDHTENLVLEHLKAIRTDVAAIRDELRELTHRTGRVELAIAGLRRDMAHFDESHAEISVRIDRMNERIERIERRLELQP
ncbi:hypothetical protein RG903_04975 [Thermithiobacillus tepidarius DSM 3134]|uniref:hypothetical protein n=1 Tax=Thermithiobacillus tepidarius TaxID=929 RepID=UPI00041CA812|nr:hypothetical protein [Thermithiobacillus tepidarius]